MKAVIRRNKQLVCDEIGELTPGEGQVLVKTLACGICGSDLHALHHMEHMVDLSRRAGGGARGRIGRRAGGEGGGPGQGGAEREGGKVRPWLHRSLRGWLPFNSGSRRRFRPAAQALTAFVT